MIRIFSLIGIFLICCSNQKTNPTKQTLEEKPTVLTGADQLSRYLPLLKKKRIALVVNHTSIVRNKHLTDTLLASGVNVVKIMAPEHGFRGTADAGELIKDGKDIKTGLPVISLYGNNKKPTVEQLSNIDVVVFDLQDVGVRFYTYISTLHYVMEACAENNITLVVLDRPNPNGHYIDGPILQPQHRSFVGMHPIPIVHGLTVGELAQMINGEKWLTAGLQCKLEVITMQHWDHSTHYSLPVKPSPNLPTDQSIKLYPSLCLFEGTDISVGRGTLTPFQIIGHPKLIDMPYSFTPVSIPGMSKNPPHENNVCYGLNLQEVQSEPKLMLKFILELYAVFPDKDKFFNSYFEKLAGTSELRKQIQSGMTEDEIRASWKKELDDYKAKRQLYLLYQ